MFLKADKCRFLAGLLCASLFLSSCGMIIDEDMSSIPGRIAPVSTSAQTASQTVSGTGSSAAESSTSDQQTDSTAVSAGSQTASAASATQTVPASTAAGSTGTQSSAGSTTTTTTASTTASASSQSASGTTGGQDSSSKTTTTTTSGTVKAGKLTASDQAFLADCVFVGDSICSGLKAYNILPAKNVLAKGNVGVRSIFDYSFSVNGGSYKVVQGLTALKPKNVICWMGMNDINMTTSQKYCENYQKLLTKVHEALPSAALYVVSISPIATTSKFSTNKKIDDYNAAISSYLSSNYPSWKFVNTAPVLKNEYNGLRSNYSSGDGIHLSPAAYQAMLAELCRQIAPK